MRKGLWVAAAVVVAGAAAVLLTRPGKGAKEPPFRTEAVDRGDVRLQVSATGTLNAVTTVQVGSQVSGTIASLYADYNSRVRKGEVLAQLDPAFLKAQVAQNDADLERARVTVRQAERDLARQEPLRAQGLASQADTDAAQTALESARASVKSAEAALARAKTNLAYATITSPIDGIVVSRDVDVGQTVAASLSAPTLFTIANDLTKMQLEASVDEADIGMVHVDQAVAFTVDAYPDRTFRGNVTQIRLAPKTEQNVVTYTVIVMVDNAEQNLLPGMTANATFIVQEATGVLRVPAAALRFRPAERGARRDGAGGNDGAGPARAADAGGRGGRAMAAPSGRPGAEAGPGESGGGSAVYVLDGGHAKRVAVRPGVSDGTFTAVTSDSLREGMQVIVGMRNPTASAQQQGAVNPFAPGGMPRGGGRR